jgi:hypothetical protein
MVVLIHDSIYGNPVADQRTHGERGWQSCFDLLFHMDQESILEVECDLAATSCLWHCGEICMYVCHTAEHVLVSGLLTAILVLADESFGALRVSTHN